MVTSFFSPLPAPYLQRRLFLRFSSILSPPRITCERTKKISWFIYRLTKFRQTGLKYSKIDAECVVNFGMADDLFIYLSGISLALLSNRHYTFLETFPIFNLFTPLKLLSLSQFNVI